MNFKTVTDIRLWLWKVTSLVRNTFVTAFNLNFVPFQTGKKGFSCYIRFESWTHLHSAVEFTVQIEGFSYVVVCFDKDPGFFDDLSDFRTEGKNHGRVYFWNLHLFRECQTCIHSFQILRWSTPHILCHETHIPYTHGRKTRKNQSNSFDAKMSNFPNVNLR